MVSMVYRGIAAIALALMCAAGGAQTITGISIPAGSHDATSRPRNENLWSVTATSGLLNVNAGIGFLINPDTPAVGDYVLHDHVYSAPYVPDPNRAVITYQFDSAAIVNAVEIMQHTNGILFIEGFVGNALNAMVSIGNAHSPDYGAPTRPGQFDERELQQFNFYNSHVAGTYFQFVIRATTLNNGYATYRAYLRDQNGNRISHERSSPSTVPEAGSLIMLASGLAPFGLLLRRRPRIKTKFR